MDLERKRKLYNDRIVSELNNEYLILSDFLGTSKPVEVLHKPCGTKRRLCVAKDIFRKGCPKCEREKYAHKRMMERAKGYIKEIESKYNVTAIGEYKGARCYMDFKCNACGKVITKTPEAVLWGNGIKHECKKEEYKSLINALKCREKELRKQQDWIRRQDELIDLCLWYTENGYDVIDISENLNTIKLKHLACGREYNTTKDTMKRRHGCVACSRCGTSLGVQIIEKRLKEGNVPFEREISFSTCKRRNVLPFDFEIKDKEGNIFCLIEYNGEQHYKPAAIFGGKEKFNRVQETDNIKKQWCKDNGIDLVVIKYNDDIEETCHKIIKRYWEQGDRGTVVLASPNLCQLQISKNWKFANRVWENGKTENYNKVRICKAFRHYDEVCGISCKKRKDKACASETIKVCF